MTTFRFPTFDEMRALELVARRARSRELARLVRLGGSAIASAYKHLFSGLSAKRVAGVRG
jgi:hypothetical protein